MWLKNKPRCSRCGRSKPKITITEFNDNHSETKFYYCLMAEAKIEFKNMSNDLNMIDDFLNNSKENKIETTLWNTGKLFTIKAEK